MRSRSTLFSVLVLLVSACEPEACRPGSTYASCASDSECSGGATCDALAWDFGEGRRCALDCEDELDCDRVGGRTPRCLDVGRTGSFACYTSCAIDDHCPPGWVCQSVSTGGHVCLP